MVGKITECPGCKTILKLERQADDETAPSPTRKRTRRHGSGLTATSHLVPETELWEYSGCAVGRGGVDDTNDHPTEAPS